MFPPFGHVGFVDDRLLLSPADDVEYVDAPLQVEISTSLSAEVEFSVFSVLGYNRMS